MTWVAPPTWPTGEDIVSREEPLARGFTIERLEGLFELVRKGDAELRHDVDASPAAALALAAYELEHGIRSTFYVWRASPDYSRATAETLEVALRCLGHVVGRHVDLDREELPKTGRVSFHNPGPDVLWRDFPPLRVALGPGWAGRYYADSRGSFRFGDPEDHDGAWPIQINLHPERWLQPIAADAERRARAIVDAAAR